MPLYENAVEARITSLGHPRIFCSHCHQPADYTEAAADNGVLALELTCPSSSLILGTWPNEQQRTADIGAFLEHKTRQR
jgi:hypothetical protein